MAIKTGPNCQVFYCVTYFYAKMKNAVSYKKQVSYYTPTSPKQPLSSVPKVAIEEMLDSINCYWFNLKDQEKCSTLKPFKEPFQF